MQQRHQRAVCLLHLLNTEYLVRTSEVMPSTDLQEQVKVGWLYAKRAEAIETLFSTRDGRSELPLAEPPAWVAGNCHQHGGSLDPNDKLITRIRRSDETRRDESWSEHRRLNAAGGTVPPRYFSPQRAYGGYWWERVGTGGYQGFPHVHVWLWPVP